MVGYPRTDTYNAGYLSGCFQLLLPRSAPAVGSFDVGRQWLNVPSYSFLFSLVHGCRKILGSYLHMIQFRGIATNRAIEKHYRGMLPQTAAFQPAGVLERTAFKYLFRTTISKALQGDIGRSMPRACSMLAGLRACLRSGLALEKKNLSGLWFPKRGKRILPEMLRIFPPSLCYRGKLFVLPGN